MSSPSPEKNRVKRNRIPLDLAVIATVGAVVVAAAAIATFLYSAFVAVP